jgi:hypothetical protein
MSSHVQEAPRTPNRYNKNIALSQNIKVKTISTENNERILKAIREKNQITYKGKPTKIIADFSTETFKARRTWSEIF